MTKQGPDSIFEYDNYKTTCLIELELSAYILFKRRKRLLAPRVGASKRILAPRLGNGIPLTFIFSLGANNLLVGKRLLAPRVGASKSYEILAPRLQN